MWFFSFFNCPLRKDNQLQGVLAPIIKNVNNFMDDKTNLKKEKKSQKRIDRQARKNERRRLKSEALAFEETKMLLKPVKARLSKKSLPGFLAKNARAIVQWLKDYSTLFVMADDYGV